MHIIIQAGGKGTRLEAMTRNKPKCLVPVNNRPMIFWAFKAFSGHDIKIICDYKSEALKNYLDAFGSEYCVEVVNASGTGTASGISQAIAKIRDNEPIVILWCDLLLNEHFELPKCLQTLPLSENYVGLSGSFPCRWSFRDGKFIHAASESSGVAGFFVLKNKEELSNVPENGALVPWFQSTGKPFTPFYLENIVEIGTVKAFENYTKPSTQTFIR